MIRIRMDAMSEERLTEIETTHRASADRPSTIEVELVAEVHRLRYELASERARTDALVAKLPECSMCFGERAVPATFRSSGIVDRCDECAFYTPGGDATELRYAPALRDILATRQNARS